MDFSIALANLEDSCTCLICLDLLRDPVTISCGDNFCLTCLIVFWNDQRGIYPCPICPSYFRQKRFSRNLQISNLVDVVKQLQQRTGSRGRRLEIYAVCWEHNQALILFCMEDLSILCIKCHLSGKHKLHFVLPVWKAAPHHRRLLENNRELLECRLNRAERALNLQHKRVLELRKKFGYKRQEKHFEFEQVKLSLQSEHEALLSKICTGELASLLKLERYLGTLSDHMRELEDLLEEAEAKFAESDITLLTSVPRVNYRLQNLRCPKPWSFRTQQYVLHLLPQYSGLDRIIKRFQIAVTFDLDTAHPQLVFSKDRKSVLYKDSRQSVCAGPRRFHLWPAVLGSKGFRSGRCYWEVRVGSKPMWTLGVCQDCLPGDWREQPSVAEGFWAVGRYSENGYAAYGPEKMEFLPVVQPSKIGIFLDYELGELSFYNMNNRSLLYAFNNSFTTTIWPYFCTGTDSEPLTILTHTVSA
ncbi:tripartite motif-containing protein 60 [Mesocricetus auratus]|uniref:Tripartite motif-containing protein 60 n=1 Tax=Mesocricetus auratus TaxID=10036 RepID=A0A1U7QMC4_MESAU|nr:tripartite motif-containing protein 60 [Mesocricetus auratus]